MGRGIVLEMTDPDKLVPATRISAVSVAEVSVSAAGHIGYLYRETWAAIGGGGRSGWTDDEWTAELSRPNVRTWVAVHGGRDVGMAQLAWSGSGDAAFVVLGVLPAFQGMGIGGDFLTRLTRLMWRTPAANGCPTRRVWLWTVPGEHPHAIPNYLARGFVRGPDID